MSKESDRLRKRFNDLAKQAQEFFEEVGVEPGNARHIADHTWALLSVEQQATTDRIRRELRKTLTLLVPEIQMRLCWTNRICRGLRNLAGRWMPPSDSNRFAAMTSVTWLATCFEKRTTKLVNCLNFCRDRALGSWRLRPTHCSR